MRTCRFSVFPILDCRNLPISDGTHGIAAHTLRGLRDTRVPMLIAGVVLSVIGFPSAFYTAFYTTLEGDGIQVF